jgi:enamine deaminase RidA (YjgF/YER057c/UK114 family)
MTTVESRLAALGLTLPEPPKPVANYVGWVVTGNLVFIAGQVAMKDGAVLTPGIVGRDLDKETAQRAARQCAVNVIAQLRVACGGDLNRVRRVVKLNGFVACTHDFTEHPYVVNGASDLMVEVFGEAGKHARAALGVAALPLNACVEVDAVVEIG